MIFFVIISVFLLNFICGDCIEAERGIVCSISDGIMQRVRLEVVSPTIIRYIATPDEVYDFVNDSIEIIQDSVKHTSTFFDVIPNSTHVNLSTTFIYCLLDQRNGQVSFGDLNGSEPVLVSKSSSFTPYTADNVTLWSTFQSFVEKFGPDEEAFYGLGQHQSNELNYKGRNEECFQYNTKICIPVLLSTKNYGIVWHTYSVSRFGDPRPWPDVGDIFTLYNVDQVEGGLTGNYSGTLRSETFLDFETNKTQSKLPQPDSAYNEVSYEGYLKPNKTDLYHFKVHYSGYVQVWINDTEVVTEHWRTAWNPSDTKFRLELTEGTMNKIRILWRCEGKPSFFGLKVRDSYHEPFSFFSEMAPTIDFYYVRGAVAATVSDEDEGGNSSSNIIYSMDGVVSGIRYITGNAPVPPKWAMGYWISRERYKTQEEIIGVVDEYRNRSVPLDVVVQDWNYWKDDQWGSHEFENSRYPSPSQMIADVHARDARFMISVWPKFYPSCGAHYKELDAIGAIYQKAIDDNLTDWVGPGYAYSFYDAYNEEARDIFWRQLKETLYPLKIDAWWMDASEPNIQDNDDMEYRKQLQGPTALGPAAQFMNAYALMNAMAIHNGQRAEDNRTRVFELTRSGYAGTQRYSTASWSGDISTRWEDMRAQITAGLNFVATGIPIWSMDIGGFTVEDKYYQNSSVDEWKELNTRWFQFGAFVPLFRSHGQFPYKEIYVLDPDEGDTYHTLKYYIELRYKLMPYIYSLAGQIHFADYTPMRLLAFDFAEEGRNLWDVDDQFMFGPSLMVAPVCTYKQRSRSVYFPKTAGGWYDFYTGSYLNVSGFVSDIDAPYTRVPLFVRPGSIIPMGAVIQSTATQQIDLTVRVYMGRDGAFQLYEDDGTTYNYNESNGANFTTIQFSYYESLKQLKVGEIRGNGFVGGVKERVLTVLFIGPDLPEGGKAVVMNYTGEELVVPLGQEENKKKIVYPTFLWVEVFAIVGVAGLMIIAGVIYCIVWWRKGKNSSSSYKSL